MKLDDQVCYCFHITQRKIRNHIRVHRPRVASQLSECGGAGTGCGWCIPFLKQMFAKSQSPAEGRPSLADLTAEEYAQARGEYIRQGKGIPPAGATPPPTDTPAAAITPASENDNPSASDAPQQDPRP